MWCNVIFIIIAFTIAFIGFTGYSLARDKNDSAIDQLQRIDLNSKLEQLPEIPAAKDRPVSAMCYDTASPLDRVQYICPACGEMTLYNSTFGDNISELSTYRQLVKKITKMDVRLDESQFCKKCSPNIKNPQYCLLVKDVKSNKTHKTCNITENDILLIYEYSEGIKEHNNGYIKAPLKNYEDRLEELLGAPIQNFGE